MSSAPCPSPAEPSNEKPGTQSKDDDTYYNSIATRRPRRQIRSIRSAPVPDSSSTSPVDPDLPEELPRGLKRLRSSSIEPARKRQTHQSKRDPVARKDQNKSAQQSYRDQKKDLAAAVSNLSGQSLQL